MSNLAKRVEDGVGGLGDGGGKRGGGGGGGSKRGGGGGGGGMNEEEKGSEEDSGKLSDLISDLNSNVSFLLNDSLRPFKIGILSICCSYVTFSLDSDLVLRFSSFFLVFTLDRVFTEAFFAKEKSLYFASRPVP